MNLAGKNKPFVYAAFNQDQSALSVAFRSGFALFSMDPLAKTFAQNDGGIGIVEMLFSTTYLVALVGGGDKPAFSKNTMRLINTRRGTVIAELKFTTPIMAVKMNRKRMVILQESAFGVYDMTTMKILDTIECHSNKQGICALSANSERSYFAYPSQREGVIQIMDAGKVASMIEIRAHQGPIQLMVFNQEGNLLATASDKGTLVRVFSLPSGERLYEFRRGSYPATISSLSFSPDLSFLACSSDSDTVHIFKLQPHAKNAKFGDFLPRDMNNIIDPVRNFAHLKLPTVGSPTLCSFISNEKINVIMSDGSLLQYTIDLEKGGVGTFVAGHSLSEIS
jgi:autophagy-related protein 18